MAGPPYRGLSGNAPIPAKPPAPRRRGRASEVARSAGARPERRHGLEADGTSKGGDAAPMRRPPCRLEDGTSPLLVARPGASGNPRRRCGSMRSSGHPVQSTESGGWHPMPALGDGGVRHRIAGRGRLVHGAGRCRGRRRSVPVSYHHPPSSGPPKARFVEVLVQVERPLRLRVLAGRAFVKVEELATHRRRRWGRAGRWRSHRRRRSKMLAHVRALP